MPAARRSAPLLVVDLLAREILFESRTRSARSKQPDEEPSQHRDENAMVTCATRRSFCASLTRRARQAACWSRRRYGRGRASTAGCPAHPAAFALRSAVSCSRFAYRARSRAAFAPLHGSHRQPRPYWLQVPCSSDAADRGRVTSVASLPTNAACRSSSQMCRKPACS